MKRDMDLLRTLLLGIEERDVGDGQWVSFGDLTLPEGTMTPEPLVQEHLRLLLEAGLIEATSADTLSARSIFPRRLTWEGHDFLDTIRDEGVWASTKEAVGKAGGTATLETWKAVSAEIGKALALAAAKTVGFG